MKLGLLISRYMSPTLEESTDMKSQQLSLVDAFFVSLMVGAGESYLPAYALSVGISESSAGLLTSVPLVFGALIQLLTPWGLQKINNVKRWVVATTTVQALSFVPLIYFSLVKVENPAWIFLIAGLYYGAGFAAAAPWNFWMSHLISNSESLKFFSSRLYLSQIGTLVGLIGAGIALHNKWHLGPLTSAYSLIFFIAFVSRISSTLALHLKEYRHEWLHTPTNVRFVDSLTKFLRHHSYRRFFGFLFIFYVFIFFSSPFVSPFLLKKLNFDYADFMWIIGSLFIGKMIGFSVLKGSFFVGRILGGSRLQERWTQMSSKKIFFIGAIGISPLPLLWGTIHSFSGAVMLQVVSGFAWSMFESGLAQIFFAELKKEEKITVITLFNFFYASAVVLGSLIGASCLRAGHEYIEAYHMVFLVGSILRVLLVAGFYWMTRQHRELLVD